MNDRRRQAVADLAVRHSREMASLMEGGTGAAREAFKELYEWCPEYIEHEEAAKEWEECNGKRGELPFFSELMTYAVLGKDQARTLRAHLHSLGEALGFTRLEMERGFKEPETEDLPSQDDLDALEAMLRGNAGYMIDGPEDSLPRMMRALEMVRAVVGADAWGDGVEYVRVHPDGLRVGDKIVHRGRLIPVLGFFDEDKNLSDVPVADKLKDDDCEYYDRSLRKRVKRPYWGAHIKTREDDTYGWAVRSQDEMVVQRKVK